MNIGRCSNCGGSDLRTTTVDAAGGCGPDLLPGAGGWFRSAKFEIVVCCSCGLTRFFAPEQEIEKIAKSASWERPGVSG